MCRPVGSDRCNTMMLTLTLTAGKVYGCDVAALEVALCSSDFRSVGDARCGWQVGKSMRGGELGGRQMMPSWYWGWFGGVRISQREYNG